MANDIDIILMASGFSRRFGRENKLLHVFHGKPLVAHALDLACSFQPQSGGEIFLVYSDPAVAALAVDAPVRLIRNDTPGRGPCESVRLGVAASAAAYYMFLHGDQPFLDAATLAAVAARRQPGRIVTPCYRGKPGNPSLFSAFFRDDLLSLPDGESPRLVKNRHPDRVDKVEINDPSRLVDIDSQDDLLRNSKSPNGKQEFG